MKSWNSSDARALTAPQEVQVVTQRRDGTLRQPMIIWIVGDDDRVFIRSTNGRTAGWFRGAIATGLGEIIAGETTRPVRFAEADGADLTAVDAAYRAKYGQYASIVDHLTEPGPRAATLQVLPE